MFKIRIADLIVQINNKYSFVQNFCKDYITQTADFDFSVQVTDQDLIDEQEKCETKFSKPYLESIAIYRKIAIKMLDFNILLLHGAVIELDSQGYAFCAKSGTGKTTHINLYKELLADKVTVVNGDKPLIKFENDKPFAYGTPWCGKEKMQTNKRVPLKAICFVERGQTNEITPLESGKALKFILLQTLMPKDPQNAIKTLDLIDKVLNNTTIWNLKCNMELDAAITSYEAMKGN